MFTGAGIFAAIMGAITGFGPIAWLVKIFGGGALAGVLALLTELAKIALVVVRWLVETLVEGLRHTLKSPAAVVLAVTLSWTSFALGGHFKPTTIKTVTVSEKAKPRPADLPELPERIDKCAELVWPYTVYEGC